ncbi:MAG: hypothetical protein ACLFUN_02860 [Desulfobacterales bacterium]
MVFSLLTVFGIQAEQVRVVNYSSYNPLKIGRYSGMGGTEINTACHGAVMAQTSEVSSPVAICHGMKHTPHPADTLKRRICHIVEPAACTAGNLMA